MTVALQLIQPALHSSVKGVALKMLSMEHLFHGIFYYASHTIMLGHCMIIDGLLSPARQGLDLLSWNLKSIDSVDMLQAARPRLPDLVFGLRFLNLLRLEL